MAIADRLKPRGILATPSPIEQGERARMEAQLQAESPEDVVKIIRVTKSGKTQVRLRNGLFKWLNQPPGEVAGAQPNQATNAFTGEIVQDQVEVPVRNIRKAPPVVDSEAPTARLKHMAENLGETLKEHTPDVLTVAKGVMSKKEAEESREPLANAIFEGFKFLDKFIEGTTRGNHTIVIWQDITDGQLLILADSWLYRAQTSKREAVRARRLIAMHKQVQIGAILLPKFGKTWMAYSEFGFELPGTQMRRQRKGMARRR